MGVYDKLSKLSTKPKPATPPPKSEKQTQPKSNGLPKSGILVASNRDTTTPRHRDTTVSSDHDPVLDKIRQAVRQIGKEAATHRFTVAEKKALAKIIFTYQQDHDVQTSENEITRIAINFVIADHQQNGANSILNKTLLALHS